MYKVITTICALLMSVVLSHSVKAHDTTTDSATPVELGSVFSFPHKELGVTRLVCSSAKYIDMALDDLRKVSPRRAHHFLFHDSERTLTNQGKERFKRGGYSMNSMRSLKENCKGLGPTKFAPVEVVKEVDIHGYKVSVVAIYESYTDKEGIFYTWFVNTEFVEVDRSQGTQFVMRRNRTAIGAPTFVARGFLITSDETLVKKVLASVKKQPKTVGQRTLLSPVDVSHMKYDARSYFNDVAQRGWVQTFNEKSLVTFDEFLGSEIIHEMNVSMVAIDVETTPSGEKLRFYTWLVDTEIIGPGGKRLARAR